MSRTLVLAACLLIAGCASTGAEFASVRENPRHLGITVEISEGEGWLVSEKRYEKGWRIMFRHEDPADHSRTRFVFVKADRYDAGGFARAHGNLQELARSVLRETRDGTPQDNRFQEKWAMVDRDDIDGAEAYRIRIAWEERRNPHYPNAVLVLEVVQLLLLHPQDSDEIVSVAVSTRRRLEQEPLSADTLASSFLRSMRLAR
jgi:hypothetical protein